MQSAQGAARLFCDLKKKYKRDTRKMIIGWNCGMGNCRMYGRNGLTDETKKQLVKCGREMRRIAERG